MAKQDKFFSTQKDLALDRMKKFCAYRDRCHAEVRDKLLKLEIYGDDLEEVIADLIIEGFLNEERYARSYARGKFRMNQWGKNKIRMQLKMKQIPAKMIENALGEIEDEDYHQCLSQLLQKKKNSIKNAQPHQIKQKLTQFALGKGYEYELINAVLSELPL